MLIIGHPDMTNYIFWLLCAIWLPSLVLWWFVKKPRAKKCRQAISFAMFALIPQLAVEYFILRYPMLMREGHYLGIRIFLFPIEDILFFLTIPLLVFPLVHIVNEHI
jgi:lycopene cyclase domain-containing protein